MRKLSACLLAVLIAITSISFTAFGEEPVPESLTDVSECDVIAASAEEMNAEVIPDPVIEAEETDVPELGAIQEIPAVRLWEGGPLWTTVNVGAGKPEDGGSFIHIDLGPDHMTYYIRSGENYATTTEWKVPEGYHVPSEEEWKALEANTTCFYTSEGTRLTGKGDYKDNYIYLPLCGYFTTIPGYWSVTYPNQVAYFWSSDIVYQPHYNSQMHVASIADNRGIGYSVVRDTDMGFNIRLIRDVEPMSTYQAVQKAINTAPDDEETTITLVGDITDMTSSLLIPDHKKIILDLNGHLMNRGLVSKDGDLKHDPHGSVIEVESRAELTIIDSNSEQLTHDFSALATGQWAYDKNFGKRRIDGGAIMGGTGMETSVYDVREEKALTFYRGGGIHCLGKLTVKGGTIAGNCADAGGGIYVMSNNFVIDGGTVSGNRAINTAHSESGNGGGIYNAGEFRFLQGFVSENTADTCGGGIFNGSDMYLTAENGIVSVVENKSNEAAGVKAGNIRGMSGNIQINGNWRLKYSELASDLIFNDYDSVAEITGNLAGSNIGFATVSKRTGGKTRVVTRNYRYNSGSKTEDSDIFFHFECAPGDALRALVNTAGEIEVVQRYRITNLTPKENFRSQHGQIIVQDTEYALTKVSFFAVPENSNYQLDEKSVRVYSVKGAGDEKTEIDVPFTPDFSYTQNTYVFVMPKTDVTIEAKFVQRATRRVTFDINGHGVAPNPIDVIPGSIISMPLPEAVAGWTFDGWFKDLEFKRPWTNTEAVTDDITLYAKWTQDKTQSEKKESSSGSSSSSGGTSGGSSGSAARSGPKSPSEQFFTGTWGNPVMNGTWTTDAQGRWYFSTTKPFKNVWGYIFNAYAPAGAHKADWFWFDSTGVMLTGWQQIGGKWYYLNPAHDGTYGACFIGPGKTPDGWEVDASGAWAGK